MQSFRPVAANSLSKHGVAKDHGRPFSFIRCAARFSESSLMRTRKWWAIMRSGFDVTIGCEGMTYDAFGSKSRSFAIHP